MEAKTVAATTKKTTAPKAKSESKYYAIVKKSDQENNTVIAAQTKIDLKKALADPMITDVEHVFRGKKLNFNTSTAISFS